MAFELVGVTSRYIGLARDEKPILVESDTGRRFQFWRQTPDSTGEWRPAEPTDDDRELAGLLHDIAANLERLNDNVETIMHEMT